MKTISKTISKGSQSLDYKEILKENSTKIRITIKSDSYDFQSYARVHRWNGDEWKLVDSIHYSEMQTPDKLVYAVQNQPNNVTKEMLLRNNEHSFKKDRNILLEMAMEIID